MSVTDQLLFNSSCDLSKLDNLPECNFERATEMFSTALLTSFKSVEGKGAFSNKRDRYFLWEVADMCSMCT